MTNRRLTDLLLLTVGFSILLVKMGLSFAQGGGGTYTQGINYCFVDVATKCGRGRRVARAGQGRERLG